MSVGGSRSFPSISQHNFSQIPSANIPRSSFDRSHTYRTTFNAGQLVPFYVDEALPGDTFNMVLSTFGRLTTPIKPIFDNLYLDVFFFAVPMRILWSHWEKFNGAQDNPGDSTSYVIPQIVSSGGGYLAGSIYDYMGLPTAGAGVTGSNTISHSALPLRAYNLIWNEWFRDQNLQNSVPIDTGDGPDTYTDYVILSRNKQHDYFTACLPWPQKGTAVTLPLGSSAPVIGNNISVQAHTNIHATDHNMLVDTGGIQPMHLGTSGITGTNEQIQWSTVAANSGLIADLSNATAATINQLRQAFQIQRLYERDARGGTRYVEILLSHFGVRSPDYRLQRPEYLGGGRTPINVYPLAQTGATGATGTPQGNLAAYGVHSSSGLGFNKSFTEHMILIGLVNVTSDMSYQYGLNRMWSRSTRWDFYWPALSHIGEQAVLNQEIYPQGSSADTGVFGYQERYAEYRYKPSIVTGEFRSNYATPLDFWHLAEKDASLPTLGSTWITDTTPNSLSRCVAVTTEPQIYFDAYLKLRCARPMPVYSVPGLIDHF
jgi:hypothetical protein